MAIIFGIYRKERTSHLATRFSSVNRFQEHSQADQHVFGLSLHFHQHMRHHFQNPESLADPTGAATGRSARYAQS
jgi:hypothetical protein